MLTFNLNPTQYATDIATALNYSNGAWGLYEYFIDNSPNGGGYFNMGIDADGEYHWQKGSSSIRCRTFRLLNRIKCRSSICCPCIKNPTSCDPDVTCSTCGGHNIVPPIALPPAPAQFGTGTIVPVNPIKPFGGIMIFGNTQIGRTYPDPEVDYVISEGTVENNGGGEGDPHFEGFDNIFDFHGSSGKYYQLYKSDNLLINAKMIPAYHCQDNGTFMEEIYIKGTKNGTPFEILWSYLGRADRWGLLKKIKKTYKSLLPAYRTDKSNIRKYLIGGVDGLELKDRPDWEDDEVAELDIDAGKITLSRSQFLFQYCVNFLFTPKEINGTATGVLGQTMNMKFRLPNELFEIDYINSSNLKNIILPEMHFPVKYYPMRTGKPPCTTCNDKLNPKDTYKDDKGQKWTIA